MQESLRDEFIDAVKEGSKGFFAPLVLAFRVMKSADVKDLSAFRGHPVPDHEESHPSGTPSKGVDGAPRRKPA